MKENRISLNESSFTNLCKSGFYTYSSKETGRDEISFTKMDIRKLSKGEIIEKNVGNIYKFAVQDIGFDLIKEIVKRSPLYSELYYEL